MAVTLLILNRFSKFFHCQNEQQLETNALINDKLQGTAVTYIKCGRIVNNQIKKGLLLSLVSETFFKSVNIWHRYGQKVDCVSHFL